MIFFLTFYIFIVPRKGLKIHKRIFRKFYPQKFPFLVDKAKSGPVFLPDFIGQFGAWKTIRLFPSAVPKKAGSFTSNPGLFIGPCYRNFEGRCFLVYGEDGAWRGGMNLAIGLEV